ncbi:MAG: V-type ATP synthase subunit D [Ruminococcus sp.]|jgi:V/A-type H+-transporting ATPase subunit D|nr:V-type ATP synthase subunit D [Ruminococcus sp.]
MADQVFPTKGNLLNTQKSLKLATLGYELLDKKRNILIRELMSMVDKAKQLRGTIDTTYIQAYQALQMANISRGIIESIADSMPLEDSLEVTYRSVMGCELPQVSIKEKKPQILYGFFNTDVNIDRAYICFERVKVMTAALAEVDNGIYRLTNSIRKTQTRANALQNIVIPRYKKTVKFISESLEEKEREDFSRMKVIKSQKERRKKRYKIKSAA